MFLNHAHATARQTLVGHEVIRQRPVLTQLRLVGLALARVPGEIESLGGAIVLRLGTTTGPAAAIALLLQGSTLTLYGGSVLTRWIGRVEQAVHVFGLRAVAAEQSVFAENP